MASTLTGRVRAGPVVDLSGLAGTYDFQVEWGRPNLGLPLSSPDVGPARPALIFEALEKQLGLKVQDRKIPMPVIVIDRMDRTPTDG